MEEDEQVVFRRAAEGVSSFKLESLLWNIEDQWYLDNCGRYSKVYAFKLMVGYLILHENDFASYKEANGIKPLCEDDVAYQRLCSFIDALYGFYSYE